jgi:hypothetical protein
MQVDAILSVLCPTVHSACVSYRPIRVAFPGRYARSYSSVQYAEQRGPEPRVTVLTKASSNLPETVRPLNGMRTGTRIVGKSIDTLHLYTLKLYFVCSVY